LSDDEIDTVLAFCFRQGASVCCAVDARAVVTTFGDRAAFEDFFGGCLVFGLPSRPDYLGVWGARNAARLRRLVSGAGFVLVSRAAHPPVRLTTLKKNFRRLDRSARMVHERGLLNRGQ